MSRAKDFLVAAALLLVGRRTPKLPPLEEERIVRAEAPSPHAELAALALLGLASLSAIGFVVVYAVDRIPRQTQFLGLTLGLALLFFAAAMVVTAKRLTVNEELEEDYPEQEHPHEVDTMTDFVKQRMPLLPGGFKRAVTCMYTKTPDEHFVIARHPAHPSVVVACGFSGHGFKFVPVVGEILADLVADGATRHPIALFDPARLRG